MTLGLWLYNESGGTVVDSAKYIGSMYTNAANLVARHTHSVSASGTVDDYYRTDGGSLTSRNAQVSVSGTAKATG
jgi:hypothetical protein